MRSRLSAAIVVLMLAAACGEPTAASPPTLDAVVVVVGCHRNLRRNSRRPRCLQLRILPTSTAT